MNLQEIKAKFDALNDWREQTEFFEERFGPLLEHALRLEGLRAHENADRRKLRKRAKKAEAELRRQHDLSKLTDTQAEIIEALQAKVERLQREVPDDA